MVERAFRHVVASGDPLQDRVIIWTRLTGVHEPADVAWTVARDRDLSEVVASGAAVADPDRDHTVHVDVEGLEPDSTYWYGFEAGGVRSPVARTRTPPAVGARLLRMATVSCAKYAAGFFNG